MTQQYFHHPQGQLSCVLMLAVLLLAGCESNSGNVIPEKKTYTITLGAEGMPKPIDVTATYHEGVPASADGNGNAIPELAIYSWTNDGAYVEGKVYLCFDISAIPPGAQIQSAELRLYGVASSEWMTEGNQGENAFWIERITEPWDERTLTWNNAPAVTDANRVLSPNGELEYNQDMQMEVGAMVQDMLDQHKPYGFCLSVQESLPYRSIIFSSTEVDDISKRPQLKVVYRY